MAGEPLFSYFPRGRCLRVRLLTEERLVECRASNLATECDALYGARTAEGID